MREKKRDWERGEGRGIKDAKTDFHLYPEVIIAVASKFSDSVLTEKSKRTSTTYICI